MRYAAVYALGLILSAAFVHGYAEAQDQDEAVVQALTQALDARMAVWRSGEGRVTYVRHCRTAQGGCQARVRVFATWIAAAAREHGIDPFILAAIAVRESGLDPFARGQAGEQGIVQLHPQGVGRRVRFVRSEAYRRSCTRQSGACQREVLDVGAEHVALAMRQCDGLEAGLGAYNSGECRETAYTRRILRERLRLLALAKADLPRDRSGDTNGAAEDE